MNTTAERMRAYRGPALFSYGFRPFFLLAALWPAFTVPVWTLSYLGFIDFAARDWHVHEMLFGYLAGVVAGFLLTAVPNWTGRLPVVGAPLMTLCGLWLAGRLAMLFESELGALAAIIDALFLFALAGVVWREVLAGRNLRNLPVCVLVSLFALANVAFHLRTPAPEGVQLGERLALCVAAMLIAFIGGRIVPSFTRNWMARAGMKSEPAAQDWFDSTALALTALALVLWLAAPTASAAGFALCAAGAALLVRLVRWRGWRTGGEALVAILHIGYLWLAFGMALFSLSAFGVVTPSAGIHALAAGAIGVMTLAVMTRATRGHTGRALHASWGTQIIYWLVNLGALGRVASALWPDHQLALLAGSACLWSAAFALFALIYGPMLLSARPSTASTPR